MVSFTCSGDLPIQQHLLFSKLARISLLIISSNLAPPSPILLALPLLFIPCPNTCSLHKPFPFSNASPLSTSLLFPLSCLSYFSLLLSFH